MTSTERLERRLAVALARGDRVATINLAQLIWAAGDLRRTAVVAMVAGPNDCADMRAMVAEDIVSRFGATGGQS